MWENEGTILSYRANYKDEHGSVVGDFNANKTWNAELGKSMIGFNINFIDISYYYAHQEEVDAAYEEFKMQVLVAIQDGDTEIPIEKEQAEEDNSISDNIEMEENNEEDIDEVPEDYIEEE